MLYMSLVQPNIYRHLPVLGNKDISTCTVQRIPRILRDFICPVPLLGLHLPGSTVEKPRFIPLQVINGLSYLATRNDMHDPTGRMLTRANKYVQWHRNLGLMPMSTLRKTKPCVVGLETLSDSHFPGDECAGPAAREAKMHHVDRPQPTIECC